MLGLVRWLCAEIKHWVLERAHPLPKSLEVFPGAPGSVQNAIVMRVLEEIDFDSLGIDLELCVDEENGTEPRLWVDESEPSVDGWMSVCRYLGRIWKLYPVHPENAAHLDTSLELLDGAVKKTCRIKEALKRLEARMPADGLFLESMASMSVADLCWQAALEKMSATEDIAWADVPSVGTWWLTRRGAWS